MQRFRQIAPGVFVATASRLTSTSTLVASADGGCLLIDPAVTVSDLAALAVDINRAGLRLQAGYATHPHWDHVLWSTALGDVPRYATEGAVELFESMRTEMTDMLQRSEPGHDVTLFGRLTALPGDARQIPWDGPAAELIVHDGHTPGHGAVYFPAVGVLVAGDMLSDIEIPILDTVADDPLGDYRTGLRRLATVRGVRWVVPGHGHIGDAAEFRRRLDADNRYLDLLAAGEPFEDPRMTMQWQRDCHADQLRTVAHHPGGQEPGVSGPSPSGASAASAAVSSSQPGTTPASSSE
jgi:hydroxyacylglutathione hydrolase